MGNLTDQEKFILDCIDRRDWFDETSLADVVAQDLERRGYCQRRETRFRKQDDGKLILVFRYWRTTPPSPEEQSSAPPAP